MKNKYVLLLGFFFMGMGEVFAQYTDLFNFNGVNGALPVCQLVQAGGRLYGTAFQGGGNDSGCIFSIDINGAGYVDMHDFTMPTGAWPIGSLVIEGGKLYGTTFIGGEYGVGSVFSIDTNGSDFTSLNGLWGGYDSIFTQNDCGFPEGDVLPSGRKLFILASGGGSPADGGCVFSVDTNGIDYHNIFDFDTANGAAPLGSLTLLSGDVLYGMTSLGGAHDSGCIFSVDTNGTGYRDLHDFNGPKGAVPNGSLTQIGGVLYGVTSKGGANHQGCIFSIDTNGNNYRDLFDFNGTDGANPNGSLTSVANTLYGVTVEGGTVNSGVIFSIDTNGSNYRDMYSFNGTTGAAPYSTLTLAGSKFYGTAVAGGANDSGVVFSYGLGCSNSFNEPICMVTIDTANNKAEVIWGRTNSPPGAGTYNVFRNSGSGFSLVNAQAVNALSQYIDLGSNPSAGPVSYKLSTTDSCGESSLSAIHTTIYLTTSAGINAFVLNWTAYVGFTPSVYRIFRGPALNAMVQIDSVPSSILTFTDSFPPLGSFYAIEAVNPSGNCIPTTHKPRNGSALLSGSFSNGFNTRTLTAIQTIGSNVSKLNVYPNPSNGIITLNYSLNAGGNVATTIVNELGQIVYNNTKQRSSGNVTEQLNLENLTPGIYSLRMQTDNSIMVRKVVIMGNR